MTLLERGHPLEVLAAHARRAAEGQGSLVLVAGEAGIGKTMLLREFAAGTRLPVLWGMCDPLTTPRPLGPLRDVAHDLGPEVVERLDSAGAQHEIFAAVLDALRGRPRVLVVEDAHWADGATLDLVRFVARRISGLPLLLALSYRDRVGPGHPLRPVLGDLVGSPGARRLQLAPLSPDAVAELVAGRDLDPAEVHRRTGGNPFFVSQIAEQLATDRSRLPESVREAVIARTTGLTGEQRRFLELLSCSPNPVGGELLAALGADTGAIEAIAASGLVDRRGPGVAFRHEIARSAVLEATAPGTEPAMHATMIEALERVGGDASALAHHAVAAGDRARTLRYASAAAREAARSGAHRESVAFHRAALAAAGEDAERAALLEGLSVELYLTDRLADAIDVRQQALELRRALHDEVAVGAAHRRLSTLSWYAADLSAAERHDRAAMEILGGAGDPLELGLALANHAFLVAQRGDAARALEIGAEAQRLADVDRAVRGSAQLAMSVARVMRGEDEGRGELFGLRDEAMRLRLDELATSALSNLAALDVLQERYPEAETVLTEALQLSTELDTPVCTMWQQGVRARLRLQQGRLREAEEDARAVLAFGEIALGRIWPHLVLGLLAARRDAAPGNPDLDEAWRLATRLETPGVVAPVAAALAEQAWIRAVPDPRLAGPEVTSLLTGSFAGQDRTLRPLLTWLCRLGAAGVQRVPAPGPAPAGELLPYKRAMAHWDLGTPDDLTAGLRLLEDLDAKAVAARFRARLREAGVAVVPRGRTAATRANPAGLTTREVEVLALIAEGLSNADIAARLVISKRTADHHVSAILGKLQVRTRGEAAAASRRLGLLP